MNRRGFLGRLLAAIPLGIVALKTKPPPVLGEIYQIFPKDGESWIYQIFPKDGESWIVSGYCCAVDPGDLSSDRTVRMTRNEDGTWEEDEMEDDE